MPKRAAGGTSKQAGSAQAQSETDDEEELASELASSQSRRAVADWRQHVLQTFEYLVAGGSSLKISDSSKRYPRAR